MPLALKMEVVANNYGLKCTPRVFVVNSNNAIVYERSASETNADGLAAQRKGPGKP